VNEVCLWRRSSADFKELRTASEREWAWFGWRLPVVVRTAISLEKDSCGRESDPEWVLLESLQCMWGGQVTRPLAFERPCALSRQNADVFPPTRSGPHNAPAWESRL